MCENCKKLLKEDGYISLTGESSLVSKTNSIGNRNIFITNKERNIKYRIEYCPHCGNNLYPYPTYKLEDTIEGMLSESPEENIIAEYQQTSIRLRRIKNIFKTIDIPPILWYN